MNVVVKVFVFPAAMVWVVIRLAIVARETHNDKRQPAKNIGLTIIRMKPYEVKRIKMSTKAYRRYRRYVARWDKALRRGKTLMSQQNKPAHHKIEAVFSECGACIFVCSSYI